VADRIAIAAPAKINLYLHVLGRRPDGYHLLDGLIAFAGVHDTVVAAPSDALSVAIDGPMAANLDAGGDNLVARAARRLAEVAGTDRGARLTLIKRLPVAAGIGGGSADAAATLRALSRLWAVDVPDDVLASLALELGADVPMCLHGRSAFIGGIGERVIDAGALPACSIVLANPRRAISTPAVFQARRGPFRSVDRFPPPRDFARLVDCLATRGNDLYEAARRMVPEIDQVIDALSGQDGCALARMSGSGATCFALFADESRAAEAAERVAHAHPDWWVAAAPLLSDVHGLRASEDR